MKILQIGDLHFSDNPPTGRTDEYRNVCLSKLTQCANISKELQPHMILFMGDMFHLKRPGAVSHYLVNEMNLILDQFYVSPWYILGNHDIPTEGASFTWYPIASLHATPMLRPLKIGDVYFVPIYGTSMTSAEQLLQTLKSTPVPENSKVVVCTHLPFYDGPAMFDTFSTSLFKGFVDYHLNGHIHMRTIYDHGDFVYSNPGALLRVSRSASDLVHEPSIVMIDTDAHRITTIGIEHSPAEEIFSTEELIADNNRIATRNKFIQALEENTFSGTGPDAIIARIREVDVDEEVKATAIKIIQEL